MPHGVKQTSSIHSSWPPTAKVLIAPVRLTVPICPPDTPVDETATLRHVRLATLDAPLPDGLVAVQSFDLAAEDASHAPLDAFAQSYTASVAYSRVQLALRGVPAASLTLLAWDDEAGAWQAVPAQIDSVRRAVGFQSPRLTRFVLAGRPYRFALPLIRR